MLRYQFYTERIFTDKQLDINTVAAGGGSRLFFRVGLFVVGPESAGAHPGPVCYRKGEESYIQPKIACGNAT